MNLFSDLQVVAQRDPLRIAVFADGRDITSELERLAFRRTRDGRLEMSFALRDAETEKDAGIRETIEALADGDRGALARGRLLLGHDVETMSKLIGVPASELHDAEFFTSRPIADDLLEKARGLLVRHQRGLAP